MRHGFATEMYRDAPCTAPPQDAPRPQVPARSDVLTDALEPGKGLQNAGERVEAYGRRASVPVGSVQVRHPPEQVVLVQIGEARFLLREIAVPGLGVPEFEVRVRADYRDLRGQSGVLA